MSLHTTIELLPRVPADRIVVTESGILAQRDVAQMRRHGVNAFLVGEAFMRAPDPGAALHGAVRLDSARRRCARHVVRIRSTMSAIAAENISKHWTTADGEVRAVDDVSFAFDAGTLNVLLGPSGCGKSTTLRLIAGLEAADGGRILIDDRDVTQLPPAARTIAMVFQSYALFPHLTRRREHPVRPARAQGAGRASARAPRARRRPARARRRCSRASRRNCRAASSSAWRSAARSSREAPVCLMDEPLSNLDAQLRAEMRLEIRALQRKLGITMVYVTHDQVEAMSMADRVVLMRAGRIEQNGTPVELYETPANTFVARFIGTPPMNLLRLEPARGGAVIAGTDGPAVLDGRLRGGMLGVRPEHIAARVRDAAFARGVDSVEYLGGDSLVTLPRRRASRSPCASPGSVGLARGDATWLALGARRRSIISTPTACARAIDARSVAGNADRVACTRLSQGGDDEAVMQHCALARGAARARAVAALRARAGAGRGAVLLPGRRRRADHQDHRRLRRRFREGESRASSCKPIYSGSYQESIAKALTAVKSGEPPVTSILLSTDMFTLIDEDAIVPFDDLDQDRRGPRVAEELLSGVHGEQPDRRQDLGHSVPALDDRALLQQGGVQGSGARSRTGRRRRGRRWREYAQKLTKRDASGNVTQWGVQIPSSGFPVLAVPGADDRERRAT